MFIDGCNAFWATSPPFKIIQKKSSEHNSKTWEESGGDCIIYKKKGYYESVYKNDRIGIFA